MGNDFGDFCAGDTVLLRLLKMESQRSVSDALADDRCEGDDAAIAKAEQIVAAPYLAQPLQTGLYLFTFQWQNCSIFGGNIQTIELLTKIHQLVCREELY